MVYLLEMALEDGIVALYPYHSVVSGTHTFNGREGLGTELHKPSHFGM